MADMQDTEITLGTGRLLGLFFGLAVVCAVFFGMGYVLGRNTGGPAPIVQGAPVPVAVTGAPKPNGSRALAPACPEGQSCDTPKEAGSDELSFIKSEPKETAAETQPEAPAGPAAEMRGAPSLGFVVQIAAVSKKDDAETLVAALRKKSYPVFIAADGGDHLFHVQVGPFSDRKDAQTIKDRLASDGYNPIVK